MEKRKREQELIEDMQSTRVMQELHLEEIRISFFSKLEQALNAKKSLKQSLEKVTVEMDKLCRQNKKLRSSFLLKPETENLEVGNSAKRLSSLSSVIDEARSDYRAGDVEIKAEQRRTDFESRMGSRVGSVKYAEWLNAQNAEH